MGPILSASAQIICRGLQSGEEPAYLEFARQAWGSGSVQAQQEHLDWLYRHNPNTRRQEKDLLVMFDGDRIVGAHHRMRIPWSIQGQAAIVPSLHDLYVLPSHRSGQGSQLILAALGGEANAALFGLSGVSDQIYARLRLPLVPLIWLNKWRYLVRAGFQHAGSRLGRRARQPQGKILQGERRIGGFDVLWTHKPTPRQLEAALCLVPGKPVFPNWTASAYAWRFFHDSGPDNILLLADKAGTILGRAVISFGTRHGIGTGRIVEVVSSDSQCVAALVQAIEHVFSGMRVPFSSAVTNSTELAQALSVCGWKKRKSAPGARWFSRKRNLQPEDISVCGGVWDFGCDLRMEQR
jgi:hypothetical protein